MDLTDVINQAAGLIGALTQGTGLNASELADGMTKANVLVDGWNADPLKHYAITPETHALVGGTGSYTLGPAGSFSTTRPVLIHSARIILSGLAHPLDLINKEEYNAILEPNGQMTVPRKLYDDGGNPLRTIKLWPVPSGTPDLEINTPFIIPAFGALNTTVALPPAYLKALIYALATDMAPSFKLQLDPSIEKIAAQAMRDMMTPNALNRQSSTRVERAVPARDIPPQQQQGNQ